MKRNEGMRVDLIFPVLPPAINGIGDHTALLAAGLAEHCAVRVLTAQPCVDIPGVAVEQAFSLESRRGVLGLWNAVQADPPDWLVVQFEQFAYGRWGLNPYLPLVIRRIKRACPQTRVALIAHEDYVPVTSWKFALMTTWQRWQFWMLGTCADQIFFPIEAWVNKYAYWFLHVPVTLLPCCSNIPRVATCRQEARRHVGVPEHVFVAGVFGTVNASRLLPFIQRAVEALHQRAEACTVLYVGPHGDALRAVLGAGLPLIDAGALPPEAVSWHLAAMDIHLAPFADGVSTRRASFLAGLQHGVPTVSTEGPHTDALLRRANGTAFLLTADDDPDAFERQVVALLETPRRRARMAQASRCLYDSSFSQEQMTARFLAAVTRGTNCLQPVTS